MIPNFYAYSLIIDLNSNPVFLSYKTNMKMGPFMPYCDGTSCHISLPGFSLEIVCSLYCLITQWKG